MNPRVKRGEYDTVKRVSRPMERPSTIINSALTRWQYIQ